MESKRPIDMHAVVGLVQARGIPAFIEHTGGAHWTIFAGKRDTDGKYPAIAGPGFWGDGPKDHAYGDLDEFYVGPDDEGETFVVPVTELGYETPSEIAAMIERQVKGEPLRPGVTMPTVSECTGNGRTAWVVDGLGRPHGECGPGNCGPSVPPSAWVTRYYARPLACKAAEDLVRRKVAQSKAAASC